MEQLSRQHYLSKVWISYPVMPEVAPVFLDHQAEAALSYAQSRSPFYLAGQLTEEILDPNNSLLMNWNTLQVFSDGDLEIGSFQIDGFKKDKLSEISLPPFWYKQLLNSNDRVLMAVEVAIDGVLRCRRIQLLAPSYCQPLTLTQNQTQANQWSQLNSDLRNFFIESGFLEARTPTLTVSGGTEAHLLFFSTMLELSDQDRRSFQLPTSPELHLKKLLSCGWNRVFELKPCFRNGELGPMHQPEFLMLEWYRGFSNLDAIRNDVKKLFRHLSERWNLASLSFVHETTMARLFRDHFEFDLNPKTSRDEILRLAERLNVYYDPSDGFDDLFFRIFIEKIEIHLGFPGPEIVSDYPPSQAALARLTPQGWSNRFEIYWRGMELANAFDELNDPRENKKRLAQTDLMRISLGYSPLTSDKSYLTALDSGLPPCGGIALGVDRLFACIQGQKDLLAASPFSFKPS